MTFFDSTKSIVENLYLLSGPLVFIVALFALKQLKIAKRNLRINSKRQSAILAFDLSQKYIETMQSDYEQLVDQMAELGIDNIKLEELNLKSLIEVNEDNENYSEYLKAKNSFEDLEYNFATIIDKLEAYSVPFINKIADEEIAFNLDALKYICYCNLCAPAIISFREKEEDEVLVADNIIELYEIWMVRKEKQLCHKKLISLYERNKSLKTKKIKPLGTE